MMHGPINIRTKEIYVRAVSIYCDNEIFTVYDNLSEL
jgi:hypothetical protein